LPSELRGQTEENHTVFNPSRSRSWKWPQHEWGGLLDPFHFNRKQLRWKIEYGDGSEAEGITGFDTIKFGEVEIEGQAVQLAKSYHGNQFKTGSADGVLGLAFGHLNSVQPGPVKTPLETMIEQNLIREKLFTVNLNHGRESFFTFGYVDEEARAGRDVHWVDVDSRGGFWNFNSRYAKVGNKYLRRRGGAAIADTGSSLILTHPHISYMIYDRIEGAKWDPRQPGWIYPKTAKVPEVAFSVGDDTRCMIVINELNMRHVDLGHGYYFGAIQDNPLYDSGGPQFDVFGTPFLKQVYALFDVDKERFGVIKKEPDEMAPIIETARQMDSEEQARGIESSPDGSILEDRFPRRQSTLKSIVEMNSLLPEDDIYGARVLHQEPEDISGKGKERAE